MKAMRKIDMKKWVLVFAGIIICVNIFACMPANADPDVPVANPSSISANPEDRDDSSNVILDTLKTIGLGESESNNVEWINKNAVFPAQVIQILMNSSGKTGVIGEFTKSENNPIEPIALSLIALFFVIEVVNRSISMDKVTIEMIVKMLLRLLIAKILVSQSSEILIAIDNVFINAAKGVYQGIAESISPTEYTGFRFDIRDMFAGSYGTLGIISAANYLLEGLGLYLTFKEGSKLGGVASILYTIFSGIVFAGGSWILGTFFPDHPAADIYFPLSLVGLVIYLIEVAANVLISLLVQGICWIQIYMTIFLRSLEMVILGVLAPLAMAAFVSDEFKAQTKKYILQFVAISVQSLVIIVICALMMALWDGPNNALEFLGVLGNDKGFFIGKTGMLEPLFALIQNIMFPILTSMMVGKSRQIAQSIVGG